MKRITRMPWQKIPENALFIGEKSPYYNHFKAKKNPSGFYTIENKKRNFNGQVIYKTKEETQYAATRLFIFFFHREYRTEEEVKKYLEPIQGKDLCDWCKQDASCHLDYLIQLASGDNANDNANDKE